jgi:NAD(P)-dependent dehydrogenase (short-subunit alcohol dehydrogenase family)
VTTWSEADVPDQSGRVALVTGANTGIGWDTARVLAERGATVTLGCRNVDKANEAANRIRETATGATVDVLELDLSDLASVREAASTFASTHPRLDLLVNNAGVMMTPYTLTTDGYELQFATNHLGHFALTGLLLESVMAAPESRVVNVSSIAHKNGEIDFDDLQSEHGYKRGAAYGQSKLANLLFTYELQRRLSAAGRTTIAVAAHPGVSSTELSRHMGGPVLQALGRVVSQSSARGALPTLRAATDPAVQGSEYYGPSGFMEMRGHPQRVESTQRSHDLAAAQRLWTVSERLTGLTYPFDGKPIAS